MFSPLNYYILKIDNIRFMLLQPIVVPNGSVCYTQLIDKARCIGYNAGFISSILSLFFFCTTTVICQKYLNEFRENIMSIKASVKSFVLSTSAAIICPSLCRKLARSNKGYKIFLTIEKIGDRCLELPYLAQYKLANPDVKVAIATTSVANPLV